MPATPRPVCRFTPLASYKEAQCAPINGPSTLDNGISIASITVTRHPSPAQVEATSAPMNPAPITTTRHESTAVTAARNATESSSVRRVNSPSRCAQTLGARQMSRTGSRGHDEGVPGKHGAVVDLDLAFLGVQPNGAVPEHFVQLQFTRALAVRQYGFFRGPGSRQDLLGEWGAVIGQVQFLAHQRDLAGEPFFAQRLGGPQSGSTRHRSR